MKASQIAGQMNVRLSTEGKSRVIREFGARGKITAHPTESGEVLLVIRGHDGLERPDDSWQELTPHPSSRPVYADVVVPPVLPSTIQAAHEAADVALQAEARAIQSTVDLEVSRIERE